MGTELKDINNCENTVISDTAGSDGDEYGIYNYFKEHTSIAIACISALVAAMSFVFDYAMNLYNNAYLHYWSVDTIYSIQNSKVQLYTVFMAFLFIAVMFVIHVLMSRTADVYQGYYKYLFMYKKLCRDSEKKTQENRKTLRRQKKRLKTITECPEKQEIQTKIKEIELGLSDHRKQLRNIKKQTRRYNRQILLDASSTVIAATAVGVLAFMLLLMNAVDFNWGDALLLSLLVVIPVILFDLVVYFVFSYFLVRRKYSKVTDLEELNADNEDSGEGLFPLEIFAIKGAKVFATDTNIKLAMLLICASAIMCLFSFTYIGQQAAQNKKEFPIHSDEGLSYAVVYNNGESVIMKQATVDGDAVYIDTSYQKIVSAKDIDYCLQTFESVNIIESHENISD